MTNTQRDPSVNASSDRDQKGQQGTTKQQPQNYQSARSNSDPFVQQGGAADHHGTTEGHSSES